MADKIFSVCALTELSEEDSKKDYLPWDRGLKMFIQKNGVTLELNSKEIKELVACLPRTIGGSYN